MRISNGMAEIYFPSTNAAEKAQKAFIWPVYDAGIVNPMLRVTRELEGQISYTKPTEQEKERLLQLSGSRTNQSYNSTGGITTSMDVRLRPGSFFDAFA